jgi:hypothetical protein
MAKQIQLSEKVSNYLNSKKNPGESYSQLLSRLLEIPTVYRSLVGLEVGQHVDVPIKSKEYNQVFLCISHYLEREYLREVVDGADVVRITRVK